MDDMHGLQPERLVWMFTQMLRIREFEERVKRSFTELPGLLRGHTHLADGAEASIVGSLTALRPGDPVPRFRARLIADGILTAEQADAIAADVRQEMAGAVDFGASSPFPEPA